MAKKKMVWSLSATVLLLLVAAGIFFLVRPTWVFDHFQKLRLALSGVESHELRVDGHRLHYYVSGPVNGDPIVLIHGLGGRAEDWVELTPYLVKAGYRVYSPDLLGFGQSEEPYNETYSISNQSKLLVDLMDKLGLKQVDVAGWSMGGWVAQRIAIDHPEHVRRLVLMDSVGLQIPPAWDTRLFTPTTPEEIDQLNKLLMPNPPKVPGFVAQDILRLSASYSWVIHRALASMLSGSDVTDTQLPSLKMPVLILWGDQDHIAPLSEGQTMHKLIPQSRLVVAAGCGHLAPEQCANRFGPEMVSFLDSSSPMGGESLLAQK